MLQNKKKSELLRFKKRSSKQTLKLQNGEILTNLDGLVEEVGVEQYVSKNEIVNNKNNRNFVESNNNPEERKNKQLLEDFRVAILAFHYNQNFQSINNSNIQEF